VSPLGDLLLALGAGLPAPTGSPENGAVVSATDVALLLPLESRIGGGAVLHASLPRGRMATGFSVPLGRLELRFTAESPAEDGP
jgi:hypothetical protein